MTLRILVALLAGIGTALAFEPVGIFLLLPLGVATFVLSSHGLSPRAALLPGLAYGAGFMYVLIFWMRVVGIDAWLGVSAFEACWFAVLASVTVVLRRLPFWPVWVATAWVTSEVIRGAWPFGGFPWGRLAFATVDTPFAEALPYLGTSGVSLLLALLGATLAWAALTVRTRPVVAAVGVLGVVALGVGPALAPYSVTADRSVTVAAVQGNVPGAGDDILLDHRQVTQNHVDSTVALAGDVTAGRSPRPDFVLWPENSTAVDPFNDVGTNSDILAASAAIDVPILVGAIVDAPQEGRVLNQGIVWDPETGGGDRYTKRHPVAFGEYIPFRNSGITDVVSRLDLIPRDMLGGTRLEPLRIGGVRVADAICFDVAYDDGIYGQVRNGAEMVVVQTSNAMFINTYQIEQQFEISRLRAMETGKYVVVAAVNGVSGVIAPDGKVLERADPKTQAVLLGDIGLNSQKTPAVVLGSWPGWIASAVTAVALALGLLAYRRRQHDERSTPPVEARPVPVEH